MKKNFAKLSSYCGNNILEIFATMIIFIIIGSLFFIAPKTGVDTTNTVEVFFFIAKTLTAILFLFLFFIFVYLFRSEKITNNKNIPKAGN